MLGWIWLIYTSMVSLSIFNIFVERFLVGLSTYYIMFFCSNQFPHALNACKQLTITVNKFRLLCCSHRQGKHDKMHNAQTKPVLK